MQKFNYEFDIEGHTIVTPSETPSPAGTGYKYGIVLLGILGLCIFAYYWWFL